MEWGRPVKRWYIKCSIPVIVKGLMYMIYLVHHYCILIAVAGGWKQVRLRIWNVKGLNNPKTPLVVVHLERLQMDKATLQETQQDPRALSEFAKDTRKRCFLALAPFQSFFLLLSHFCVFLSYSGSKTDEEKEVPVPKNGCR